MSDPDAEVDEIVLKARAPWDALRQCGAPLGPMPGALGAPDPAGPLPSAATAPPPASDPQARSRSSND